MDKAIATTPKDMQKANNGCASQRCGATATIFIPSIKISKFDFRR
jgi:hypothetical protein